MLTIRLEIEGQKSRFAQNKSKTFDSSFTVCERSEAKRFEDHNQCYRWLKRHGFPVKTPRPFPGIFVGWAIEKA